MAQTVAAIPRSTRIPAAATDADPPDFEALYAQYARFVWRVLRTMGVHEAMVADAVQDVFIVVHRRYPEFDHRYKVRTWLFEIAYRVSRDYRRKATRARLMFVPEADREQIYGRSPAEDAEQNEDAQLLLRLLEKLDPEKREVLVLAEIEGLTAPEIALVTGTQLNTVYSRLRRARTEFSQLVAIQRRRA